MEWGGRKIEFVRVVGSLMGMMRGGRETTGLVVMGLWWV